MRSPISSMMSVSAWALVTLALAAPAGGQEPATTTLGIEQRPAAILAEAHELLGHDMNTFYIAKLVARTANQAARYCELDARYGQALDDKYTHDLASLFEAATIGPQVVPIDFGEAALGIAKQYAWERDLMTVSISATDSEFPILGRACEEARNATR